MRSIGCLLLWASFSVSSSAQSALSVAEGGDFLFSYIESRLATVRMDDYLLPVSVQFDKLQPDKLGRLGLNCYIPIFDSRIEKISETQALWYTPFGNARKISIAGESSLVQYMQGGESVVSFDEKLKCFYRNGRISGFIIGNQGLGKPRKAYRVEVSSDGNKYQLLSNEKELISITNNPFQRSFTLVIDNLKWQVSAEGQDPTLADFRSPRVKSIKSVSEELSFAWNQDSLNVSSLTLVNMKKSRFDIKTKPKKQNELFQRYVTADGTSVEKSYWQVSQGFTKIRKIEANYADGRKRSYNYYYDGNAKLLKIVEN